MLLQDCFAFAVGQVAIRYMWICLWLRLAYTINCFSAIKRIPMLSVGYIFVFGYKTEITL